MSMTESARILIVEDDAAVRSFLGEALRYGGYIPVQAATGDEALAAVRTPPGVAVALIDGLLPDMHGARLAAAILDDSAAHDVALCFVSGAVRDSRQPLAGIAAVTKPLRVRDLLATVEQLLRWRDAPSESISERHAALHEFERAFLVGP